MIFGSLFGILSKKKTSAAVPRRKKQAEKAKKRLPSKNKKSFSPKKNVVKSSKKKNPKEKTVKKPQLIGVVTHRFSKINVAVLKLSAPLSTGDSIRFQGHTTEFSQTVSSMQIDHEQVKQAKKGQEIGLLVKKRVRVNDKVFKAE